MSNYEIISKEAISHVEIADLVKKIAKERELTYREDKIKEFVKNKTKLSAKDFKAAKSELEALEIARLDENHIVKILDIMPANGTELRTIVSHSGTVIVDENVTAMLDVLKKYQK